MSLNGLEQRNSVIALILRFSPNSIAFHADYVKVVEDRPIGYNIRIILSPNSSLPLLTITNTPCSASEGLTAGVRARTEKINVGPISLVTATALSTN